ncbi:MAG TPA: helix-turn-helix domain-containing protein [Nocardioidaceae bacterium]|jgi:AcrR family transcriptional regulator|nr:helix-turn-helix domain-containing protein [Nocardioidaceae bacterium]
MPSKTSAQGERPARRADAELNRSRILDAARSSLAESGNASMQAIAKRAGIGPGTMYRHFPTREALVLEVHRQDVAELVEAAPTLVASHPPRVALRLWLDRLALYGQIKRGLATAFQATHKQLAGEGYGPILGAIATLLDACKANGETREDVEPEEVLLLVGFLWRIETDDKWAARTARMLDLVMDGLAPGDSGPSTA